MFDDHTPKRRFLGMSNAQLSILGGMLVVLIILLGVAAMLLFSPGPLFVAKATSLPTNTPTPTLTPAPTATRTPLPDYSGAVLLPEDLPAYESVPDFSDYAGELTKDLGIRVNTYFGFLHHKE